MCWMHGCARGKILPSNRGSGRWDKKVEQSFPTFSSAAFPKRPTQTKKHNNKNTSPKIYEGRKKHKPGVRGATAKILKKKSSSCSICFCQNKKRTQAEYARSSLFHERAGPAVCCILHDDELDAPVSSPKPDDGLVADRLVPPKVASPATSLDHSSANGWRNELVA